MNFNEQARFFFLYICMFSYVPKLQLSFCCSKILIKWIFMCLFWIESYSNFCHINILLLCLFLCFEFWQHFMPVMRKGKLLRSKSLATPEKTIVILCPKYFSWCDKAHGSFLFSTYISLFSQLSPPDKVQSTFSKIEK